MADRLSRRLAVLASLAIPFSAVAEDLPDPTRPPALPGESAGMPGAPAKPAGLQMIIRRPGHKPVAVINGEYVELGGRISGSRLVRIGDDSVVLEGPSGRETLVLTPGIAKKAASQDGQKGKTR